VRGFVAALFAGLTLAPLPAAAQPSAEAEIRKTLAQWTEDFNARRADRVCDLFAKDLVAKFRGAPERGYARQCELLTSALADPKRRFHNALEIREILVFGDTAIAATMTAAARAVRSSLGSMCCAATPTADGASSAISLSLKTKAHCGRAPYRSPTIRKRSIRTASADER
jgi:ketosteroid isomerase-like protein